jgi:plasmid stabilization system protein ParE
VTYRFLSPAESELVAAAEYYDRAVPGLGLEFLNEVERTIGRILHHPEAWTKITQQHRRCRTRRFPYAIIYAVENETIIISAVMHGHRHPDYWKSRE